MNNRKREKGIALIVLAVTIIVILILVGVTIVELTSKNGRENQVSIATDKTKEINETKEENNGVSGTREDIVSGITASQIAKTTDKTGIYGEKVTNYTSPNTTGVNTWRIFFADTENIYLIADDYIDFENVPKGRKGTAVTQNITSYMLSMNEVYKDYDGATSIDNAFARKWLSSYWKNNSTSTNDNIRAVAYILDKDVWNSLYRGKDAEYAIGGPTVEMFVKSWNDTHSGNKQITCSADLDVDTRGNGYKVKFANGSYNIAIGYLAQNEYNSIYVKSDDDKANAMWLASPSANYNGCLMLVYGQGYLGLDFYDRYDLGFRPVVCLNSKVSLQKVADGYEIITK